MDENQKESGRNLRLHINLHRREKKERRKKTEETTAKI